MGGFFVMHAQADDFDLTDVIMFWPRHTGALKRTSTCTVSHLRSFGTGAYPRSSCAHIWGMVDLKRKLLAISVGPHQACESLSTCFSTVMKILIVCLNFFNWCLIGPLYPIRWLSRERTYSHGKFLAAHFCNVLPLDLNRGFRGKMMTS
jgi:hypothetical protein